MMKSSTLLRTALRNTMRHMKLRQLASDERGSELVEFAMCAMILFTLMFGILDFSRAAYTDFFISYAAQQGARYAMVRGYGWNGSPCSTTAPPNFTLGYDCVAAQSDVQNYVQSLALPLISPSKIVVTASWPGTTPDGASCSTTNGAGCYVKVSASYKFNFALPILSKFSAITFSGTSQKVIQE